MKRIRINNDFTFAWAIERNGLAENLSVAINRKLYLRISTGERLEVSEYTIAGNIISVEVTPELAPKVGRYNFIFQYELLDLGLSDAERLCEVDTDAFIIVPRTAEADDSKDLLVVSDMAIGFKGASAYQIWLDAGNTGTVEDYLADIKGDPFTYSDFTPEQIEALKVKGDAFEYSDFTPEQIALLQQPASDAAGSIALLEGEIEGEEALRVTSETNRNNAEGLRLSAEVIRNENEADRIEAEGLRAGAETGRQTAEGLRVQAELNRQTNTSTAIFNAEQATDDANDAAILANEKAGLANDAATLANEKAGLAATATTQANEARDGANSAAQSATNLVNSYATDLAAKELKANKQNSLAPDGTGTKFPTVDAVNAGLVASSNLLYQYIHSGNIEVYISAIDYVTHTFTSVNHGLVNNDKLGLRVFAEGNAADYIQHIPFRTNSAEQNTQGGYFVINANDDTFQISTTANGNAIGLIEKSNANLARFRFEKVTPFNMLIDKIPKNGLAIEIFGDIVRIPHYIYINGIATNSWGYNLDTGGTIPTNGFLKPAIIRAFYKAIIRKTADSFMQTREVIGLMLNESDSTKFSPAYGKSNVVLANNLNENMTSLTLTYLMLTNDCLINVYKL